jgi:hypothetical protein
MWANVLNVRKLAIRIPNASRFIFGSMRADIAVSKLPAKEYILEIKVEVLIISTLKAREKENHTQSNRSSTQTK